ncbi:MAG: isocitrate lyase/PEP mutase family protein [Chloroflexi bacterium]|nr:isocitrate lyase/PEP mutase family protein [Chloroflexota bacterium]MYA50605.1 isocitrate lyase/PEP mutase family protein [Chloroflexota bacterium]MYB85150.1 isocitrate lyase/PEP mutase family protein [Chloroflexota bacterium]MYK33976.1 isocitrate lyase/PEP mutase family protein [Chloroflexota bacterium]
MRTTTRLRELLSGERMLLAPFTYDGFTARIAQEAGFDAVYMSGFATSMSRGLPDVGLLTQTEMVQNAASIASVVDVPVVADADTGYGNAINVHRTVREYERAGVAGVHVEDQVAPKKCGFFEGKQVIDVDEAASKIRAAVEARSDDDFVVIARTDALAVNGWDDVERRCRAFVDAGADLVFVDGIRTSDDLKEFARRLGDLPRMYNGELPPGEVEALGFRFQIHRGPIFSLYPIIKEMMVELRQDGRISAIDRFGTGGELRTSIAEALGLGAITEMEKRYAVR